MSESLIAYLLYGVLKALEYLHRMGYVHRSVGEMRRYRIQRNIYIYYIHINIWILMSVHIFVSSQGGEGQSYPAVRGGACLPLRAPQCLQYDA